MCSQGDCVAGKGAPTGWFTKPGSLKNTSEWTLDPKDTPWATAPGASGHSSLATVAQVASMRCEVTAPPIGGSSSYLYSDTMTVTPGQMLQVHFWAKLLPDSVGDFPKFELIFPPWPAGGQVLQHAFSH